MRMVFVFLLCLPGFASADTARVNDLIDGFHQAASDSAFENYFSRFAEDAYFLGTDASERWSVTEFKEYARPAFSEGRGWTYKVVRRNLETVDEETFWFDEVLINKALGKCRGTGVVVKENGEWKIAHYSLSMLIPNEIADEIGLRSMEADGILAHGRR